MTQGSAPAQRTSRTTHAGRRAYAQAVRDWAMSVGMLIDQRGRLPIAMVDAYEKAMTEQNSVDQEADRG